MRVREQQSGVDHIGGDGGFDWNFCFICRRFVKVMGMVLRPNTEDQRLRSDIVKYQQTHYQLGCVAPLVVCPSA